MLADYSFYTDLTGILEGYYRGDTDMLQRYYSFYMDIADMLQTRYKHVTALTRILQIC